MSYDGRSSQPRGVRSTRSGARGLAPGGLQRHHAESRWNARDATETGVLQAADDSCGDTLARSAGEIADIVKEPAFGSKNAMELAIEFQRIEVASQIEDGRIMDDPAERAVAKAGDDLCGIADELRDARIIKEIARPGIQPRDLQRGGIKFD